MQSIEMNGIKLSDPHFQVSQSFSDDAGVRPVHLYRLLAADRINIAFLNLDYMGSRKRIACCVEPEKATPIRGYSEAVNGIECRNDTGMVSVYPHKFSLKTIGFLLSFLGRNNYRFHHLASSMAMVTVIMDSGGRRRMAEALAGSIGLPPSHGPLQAARDYDRISVSLRKDPETVATYVESRIKTYGIRTRSGLVLCRIDMDADQLDAWGERIQAMDALDLRFCFISAVARPDGRMRMNLVVDSDRNTGMADRIAAVLSGGGVEIRDRIAWIGFQGPHFGDRYGIADQTFSTLEAHSVPVLVAGCVGAAVSIILPEEMLPAAEAALSETIDTP